MRRLRPDTGFTLLETMVALLILAMSLTALVDVQSMSTSAVIRSKNLALVTELARGKMYDLILEIKKKGFSEFEDTLECDFEQEEHPEIGCSATLSKIDIPIPEGGDLFGLGGDMQNEQAANQENSPVGMVQQAAKSLVSMYSSMIKDMVTNAVRQLTLTVTWKDNGIQHSFTVTTHLIDVMRAGGTGMPSMPKIPGFGSRRKPGGKKLPFGAGSIPPLPLGAPRPGTNIGWPR
ncbi:MAG: prepilin-type N-terminal cleavage/methylation domain-containing protein [Deltaproteobacteria bacterium]|nr:prepilin-type N-terminal cleavage/methylation domain-containing protein [Deltaproteobacteria bacterium]